MAEPHTHRWLLPTVQEPGGGYLGRCECGAVKVMDPYGAEDRNGHWLAKAAKSKQELGL